MIDQLTLTRIDTLHPKIKEEVKNIYLNEVVPALKTVTCRFAYTLRTIKEQNDLYALGRTKLFDANGKRLGIVTNAKGGQSYHNYGLAFDIVLLTKNGASWDIKTIFCK
jgi:peptidoglycan L-alanyl-D-glutamate endopeptidase CwlK